MTINDPVCNIRMIDSLNFIPMPLADMSNAFGEIELAKGYFSHLFNLKENQLVTLTHLPDVAYYTPDRDSMKPEARQGFLNGIKKTSNSISKKKFYATASPMWIS